MKNLQVKFSTNNEVETVTTIHEPKPSIKKRIDEERLFGLFTASIIKQKKQFTR